MKEKRNKRNTWNIFDDEGEEKFFFDEASHKTQDSQQNNYQNVEENSNEIDLKSNTISPMPLRLLRSDLVKETTTESIGLLSTSESTTAPQDKLIENVTVKVGQQAVLPCFVNNLGSFKVSFIFLIFILLINK